MKEILILADDKYRIIDSARRLVIPRDNVAVDVGKNRVEVFFTFEGYLVPIFVLKGRNGNIDGNEIDEHIEKYCPKDMDSFIEWCQNQVLLHRGYMQFVKLKAPKYYDQLKMNKDQDICDYLFIKHLRQDKE